MLESIATAVAVLAAFVGALSWLVGVVSMIRVTFHIKDGVTIYGRKTNVMFQPRHLTERGLAVRRQFFHGLFGLALSAVTMFLSSMIIESK